MSRSTQIDLPLNTVASADSCRGLGNAKRMGTDMFEPKILLQPSPRSKVPDRGTPYGRAKHLQLVDKDATAAVAAFKEAIMAGDRVDSALKDMAVVLKQQQKTLEAISCIESYRHLCSALAQDSLDNVLIDLYKKCGKVDEQISLLKHKLFLIQQGAAFNGRFTKTARSHGRKFQVSIIKETTRLLSNLGWAYLQQKNYSAAEVVYRKAQQMDADDNKACNLALCLMRQGKLEEAADIARTVIDSSSRNNEEEDTPESKMVDRARDILREIAELHKSRDEALHICMSSRKRNRLRVFQQMTSLAKEVAF